MISTPSVTTIEPQQTAVVRLVVAAGDFGAMMGPAIGELMEGLAAQAVYPDGRVFAYYRSMEAGHFELEVGVPVHRRIEPRGRLTAGELPGGKVAETVYEGPYDGLHSAWADFGRWLDAHGYKPRSGMWETYEVGPDMTSNPLEWRTLLTKPIA